MKNRMILAALLLMALGTVRAQEKPIPTPDGDASRINTLVINCVGSVYLQQGEKLMLDDYGHSNVLYHVEDSVLYLEGVGSPRVLTIPNLTYLKVSGTANVRSKGQLKGENLSIHKTGTGVLSLEVGFDNIYVYSKGTGDVILLGDCNVFCGEAKGIGKVNTRNLDYKVLMETSGGQWNMAFNLDDSANKEWIYSITEKAQPFFETESKRLWYFAKEVDTKKLVENYKTEWDELMREYNANLQRVYDSIDWKRLEEDMTRTFEEYQREYDSVDWKSIEKQMKRAEKEMEEWGRRMEEWGRQMEKKYDREYEYHYEYNKSCPESEKCEPDGKRPKKKNLLFDAHWNGFGAGLNMLLGPGSVANFENEYAYLELRPLRSWVFNFNIADVGIAFDRRHTAGLFTGVGIGWNNYSFNHPIRLIKGEDRLEAEWIDTSVSPVKKSKLGVLYLQVPLMIEVRPTRHFNIAAGVTGGLRIDTWTAIKYQNGDTNKVHSDFYVNPFKLDASLRVGSDYVGFFADFNLLPTFDEAHASTCHTASFGLSLNF